LFALWNHIFELLLQIIEDFIDFSRHNPFQSNWNFLVGPMDNEIRTKFQHFYLILSPFVTIVKFCQNSDFLKIVKFCHKYQFCLIFESSLIC